MIHPWQIDELDHAGAEHLDTSFVAGYDRKQGAVAAEQAVKDVALLRELGLGPDSTVVDMGAGTGRFTLKAAEAFGRVVAVDVSAAMRDYVKQRATAQGLSNIDFRSAGWLSYEHQGPPPAAVYSRNALHQIPDFWKVLALHRIADLLPTGGILRLRDLVYGFAPDRAAQVFQGWFDGAATDPAQGYTRQDYIEHIRGEYSTFTWLLEPMLTNAGFEVLHADTGDVFAAYTCVKR